MKTIALISTVFVLPATSLFAAERSDIESLRVQANKHERRINQLEQELSQLRAFHRDKQSLSKRPTPAATSSDHYVVVKGDILSRIAYRNKTTVAAIKKENGLRNDRIQIGQKLRIPGGKSTPVAEKAPVKKQLAAAPKISSKHIVKNGETFYSIARQHKVSLQSLVNANPSIKPNRLRAGNSLFITGTAESAPKKHSEKIARKVPAKRSEVKNETTITTKSSEPSIRTITVNKQLTYGQFASKYGASTNQLNSLNGLSLNKNAMLAKGSELYVPQF